jgi:hypothetical protein
MPLLPIETLTFYLPFPDGVLDYVCAECDALCCRGQGFGGSLSREMTKLLALYPALELAVTSRRGDVLSVQTPTGRCYFLRDDNRCRIEEDHGKQMKPGVCGLFPFNKFSRVSEDIIVVMPHFMCPLRVVLPRSEKVEGVHHKVIQAAKESFLLDSVDFSTNIDPVPLAARQTPAQALRQEISFRDTCSEALQQKSFLEVLSLTSNDSEALQRFLPRTTLVCGVVYAAPKTRDYLDDLLLVLASSWRVGMLHLGQERMLRVLALAGVLLRRLASLSPRALTPQQVNHFFGELSPALRLLSRNETPLTLPKAFQKVPPFGAASLTFTAYRALRGAEKNVLVSFEESFSKDLSVADRMAVLVELGAHTEHATAPKPKKAK